MAIHIAQWKVTCFVFVKKVKPKLPRNLGMGIGTGTSVGVQTPLFEIWDLGTLRVSIYLSI